MRSIQRLVISALWSVHSRAEVARLRSLGGPERWSSANRCDTGVSSFRYLTWYRLADTWGGG